MEFGPPEKKPRKKICCESSASSVGAPLAKLSPYLPEVAVYYSDLDGPERVFSETDKIVKRIRIFRRLENFLLGLRLGRVFRFGQKRDERAQSFQT